MDLQEKQKMLKEYDESLKGKTLEELEKIESELIVDADENDKIISQTSFDLPEENYEVIAKGIRQLLNKQTVQWQYTLGLVALYDFWNPEKKADKIPYAQLDAVLRTLGQMQFTGYEEWAAVVAINKYFEPLHKAYVDVTEKTYDIASKHQSVMQAMDRLKNPEQEEGHGVTPEAQ
jgi:hypothetical protein